MLCLPRRHPAAAAMSLLLLLHYRRQPQHIKHALSAESLTAGFVAASAGVEVTGFQVDDDPRCLAALRGVGFPDCIALA